MKRVFDCMVSLLGIIAFLPLMIVLAILILLFDGASPLYIAPRIGRGGHPFGMIKYRTMKKDADKKLAELIGNDRKQAERWQQTAKLAVDPRISSPLGRFLRKTSLDELPQLFNVLAGKMSLVGPRPIQDYEIDRYGELFSRLVSVRPGMTGLWQVSGRNDLSYSQRIQLDMEYINHQSFALDMKILLKTVREVLAAHGC